MYWFLAICIWPFTRLFARMVSFIMNLLDREWWDTDNPTNTARFLRALTTPWMQWVWAFAYLLIVVEVTKTIGSIMRPDYVGQNLIMSTQTLVVSAIMVTIFLTGSFQLFYPNSLTRRSWRNRHRRVWFLKCDFPHIYQHHSGIFVGTSFELWKFLEAGKKYYDDGDGTSCRAKWRYTEFSLPVSWMFGEGVDGWSSMKFRPTWRGQDTCYWVQNKFGERILWDANASTWGLFDSMMSDKLGILFALEEEKQRAYRRHARDFTYLASAFETSKKSEPSRMMKLLSKVCRDLTQHYITMMERGVYDQPTPSVDELFTHQHTYSHADPNLFRR